ncbi:hypothetical protein ACQ4PT_017958 [Festuca glaucescens]
MLRSIVARSQPFLSHLRRRAAAPGGAILPSRAHATSSTPATRCNGSADEMTPAAAPHLYVVLKETYWFSIYKLSDVDEVAVTDDEALRRLPRATLRLSESLIGTRPHFEALLYDTNTGVLDGGRPLPNLESVYDERLIKDDRYHAAAAARVGNELCVLETLVNKPFYLYEEKRTYYPYEWTWEQGPLPLPLDPIEEDVESHAVHPDGHTIYASSSFTFSLDTETGESEDRGKWLLPFHGRGYYDSDLGAWVGIRVANGKEGGSIEGYSYMCACDVPTALAHPRWSQGGRRATVLRKPAWKMCKEELTFVKAPKRAMSRTLVHTEGGKFYLVVAIEGGELHVTMFCAKRAKNGELEVNPCQPGRSYLVPNYHGVWLTALWM